MASGRRNYVKEGMLDRLERKGGGETSDALRQRRQEEEEWNNIPDPEDEYLAQRRAKRVEQQSERSKKPVRTPWGEAPQPRKKKMKKKKEKEKGKK